MNKTLFKQKNRWILTKDTNLNKKSIQNLYSGMNKIANNKKISTKVDKV